MRFIAPLCAALLATACATASSSGPVTLGTELSLEGSYLGPLPTMSVVMTRESPERNSKYCEQFVQMPTYVQAASQAKSSLDVIPLRWLAKSSTSKLKDCAVLIGLYDFDRATSLLAEVNAKIAETNAKAAQANPGAPQTKPISGRGPFLIEHLATTGGINYAVLDLSSSEDFSTISRQLGELLGRQVNLVAPVEARTAGDPLLVELARGTCKTVNDNFIQLALDWLKVVPWVGGVVTVVDNGLTSVCAPRTTQ